MKIEKSQIKKHWSCATGDTGVGATCDTGTCATGDIGVGANCDTGTCATVDTGAGATCGTGTCATLDVGNESHNLDFQTKMPDKHNQQFCLEFEVLCGKLKNSHDVQVTLHQMLTDANAKFLKDFASFNDFPADVDNFIVAPSIQLVESTFSTYRRVEKVDNLSKQVIYSETEFRKNNVIDWVLQQDNAENIITEATSSQTRKITRRKNIDEDLDMDRKLLNRRLVYEPTVPKKKRKDS